MRSKYQGHVLNVMHLMRSASLPFFFDDQTPFSVERDTVEAGVVLSAALVLLLFIYFLFVSAAAHSERLAALIKF